MNEITVKESGALKRASMDLTTLRIGGRYNWKNQPERLIYMGLCEPRNGRWHQFAKVEAPTVVWCEVRDDDLPSFEVTPTHPACGRTAWAPARERSTAYR